MENYYELLEIDPSWSADEIDVYLLAQNRKYRLRTNHRDPIIREQAVAQLGIIGRAMAAIGPNADRAIYDQKLTVDIAEQELNQPWSDLDLYEALHLEQTMTDEQIKQTLDEMATTLSTATVSDEIYQREQKLIMLALQVLLNPEKRATYDEQLAQRVSYAKERNATKPVPLSLNGTDVESWLELETVLDTHPQAGLHQLQDGEIEAWLRWSLGDKQRANQVGDISDRLKRSKTPPMEYQELLRLINANRPLLLYPEGARQAEEEAVAVRHASEIPQLADTHWHLFVKQVEYVIDWVAQYAAPDVADVLAQYEDTNAPEIWLERLIAVIAPNHVPPGILIQEARNNRIDFGDVNAWSKPTHTFYIKHQGRGYLYGRLHTNAEWLSAKPHSFAGPNTPIVVEIDRGKLKAGSDNHATIVIEPLDGRVETQRIDVLVHQKTLWQSVTGIFGGKR